MVKEVKPQPLKNPSPIEVMVLGICTEVRFVQLLNTQSPIDVTVLGISIEVSPVHAANA